MDSRSPSPEHVESTPLVAAQETKQLATDPESIRLARLAALERRNADKAETPASPSSYEAFDGDYVRRIEFRRLIEPGILRPNTKEVAMRSLKTLSTLAANLLRDPENEKFHSFKPTNTVIKRDLVDPKGTLEYAVEMGFRPEVDNFQPYYKFNKRHLDNLRIGASVLQEVIEIQTAKEGKVEASLRAKKEEEAARVELAKKQFLDDRKNKALRDQREKSRALAHAREHADP